MSQQLAAYVATNGSGLGLLNLDSAGNLKTITGEATEAVSASSGNVAAATAVATLPAAVGKTTHISGFTITGAGATAASVVSATLSGLLGGNLTFSVPVPAGVTTGLTPIIVTFSPPLSASAANTAIVLTLPSLGAGNTNASVSAWGYQQ